MGGRGTLYVVATPIGNLEDISLRGLRILGEVALVTSEDTRTTRHLLSAYGIHTRLTSYHQHSGERKLAQLLRVLEEKDVAMVSEAGMPTINDPGHRFVRAAWEHGIRVVPIPGATAVVTALAVSGFPADQFIHLGFLPRRKGGRRRLLISVTREERTLVAFEAPHRFRETMEDMAELLGERQLVVCRELTKVHEEIFRGTPGAALDHFQDPRGEFTLVIAGFKNKDDG